MLSSSEHILLLRHLMAKIHLYQYYKVLHPDCLSVCLTVCLSVCLLPKVYSKEEYHKNFILTRDIMRHE